MKKTIIIFTFFLFGNFTPEVCSQISAGKESVENLLENTAEEEIFIHYNTSLLFAGEYLYYKVYNRELDGKLSDISKIGYVELIGPNQEVVFKHKVNLREGTAKGDFFLPTSVPSGNYKLVGYTSWMANSRKTNFFTGDIMIINPYRGNQQAVDRQPEEDTIRGATKEGPLGAHEASIKEHQSDLLELMIAGDSFGTREAVRVNLRNLRNDSGHGSYSVSVRKANIISSPNLMKSTNFSSETGAKGRPDQVYLPELRGELITGAIKLTNSSGNIPVKGQRLALSVPGDNFLLKITRTNEDGRFFFSLDGAWTGSKAIIQVIGEEKNSFDIHVDPKPEPDYSALDFREFHITREIEDLIVQRSIHNQIENGYFIVKPDTLRPEAAESPFYGDRITTYDLDDYTRFQTIKETFVEFIRSARIRKNSDGEEVFQVTGYNPDMKFDRPPLVIVDGVFLQRHGDIIGIEAKRIKRIGILRDKYFLGTEVFQGIVSFETMEGDFDLQQYTDYAFNLDLIEPQPEKLYFHQTYEDSTEADTERIPDFRSQLLWKPNLELNSTEEEFEFYTSDIPGRYEISVEGFTRKGEPVSLKKTFRVSETSSVQ